MGRLSLKGLEYFSVDTTWETNVKLVKAKFGTLEGSGFLTELWASIYRENYYREWNEENELLFADEIKREVAWVHEVIEYCFDKKIFDRAIFDSKKVLTSHGIQKRYFKIARDSLKRTGLDYIEGITYPDFMPENNLPENSDNLRGYPDNLGGNADNLRGYDDKGRGRKGKGTKGNLNKGEEGGEPPAPPLVDNLETQEADLYAFALSRILARKKRPGDPEAMARKIMHEADVIAAWEATRPKPKPKASSIPFLEICPECGRPIPREKCDNFEGIARCYECNTDFYWDTTLKAWEVEDIPQADSG